MKPACHLFEGSALLRVACRYRPRVSPVTLLALLHRFPLAPWFQPGMAPASNMSLATNSQGAALRQWFMQVVTYPFKIRKQVPRRTLHGLCCLPFPPVLWNSPPPASLHGMPSVVVFWPRRSGRRILVLPEAGHLDQRGKAGRVPAPGSARHLDVGVLSTRGSTERTSPGFH